MQEFISVADKGLNGIPLNDAVCAYIGTKSKFKSRSICFHSKAEKILDLLLNFLIAYDILKKMRNDFYYETKQRTKGDCFYNRTCAAVYDSGVWCKPSCQHIK